MMPLFWYVLVCSLTQSFEAVITAQLMSLWKSFGPTLLSCLECVTLTPMPYLQLAPYQMLRVCPVTA